MKKKPNMNRDLDPDNRKITLLIIITAIGSVISGAALLPSYHLSQDALSESQSL